MRKVVVPSETTHQEFELLAPGLFVKTTVAVALPVVTEPVVKPFHFCALRFVTKVSLLIVILPVTCSAVPVERLRAQTPTEAAVWPSPYTAVWLVPLLIIAAISFVASWGAGDDNGVRYESDCSGVSRYDC